MILAEQQLVDWGERIGSEVELPVFIGLRGPLGAGKSVLARAVARGAGVEGKIPSPTFNLLFRYPSARGVDVVHLDLYRIDDPEDLWELGWDEILTGSDLVLVEWPERAGPHLPADRWEVELRIPRENHTLRVVSVRRCGSPPHLPGFPVTVDAGGRDP